MTRALASIVFAGACGGSPAVPASAVGNEAGPPPTPGAAYAALFTPATLTFPSTSVITRRTQPPRTTTPETRCDITTTGPDTAELRCDTTTRVIDWAFVRDPRGLWLEHGSHRVHLMQAVPKRAALLQSSTVWDTDVRVIPHAGGWCTNHAWTGESTIESWTLCLRDGRLVGGTYAIDTDVAIESFAFGEPVP